MRSSLAFFGVLISGVVVGMVNGVVGGGSVSSANLFALAASLRRARVELRSWIGTAISSAGGAVIGIYLLLTLPTRIFDFAVPVLLFFAALSVLIRVPVPKRSYEPRPRHVVPNIFASGIYSGYFGPGQGVMVLATLTHDGRLTSHEINVIKNFIIGFTGIVTTAIFIMSGRVAWPQAVLLFVGSGVGGSIGGHFASTIRPTVFRWAIFGIGMASSLYLGSRLF